MLTIPFSIFIQRKLFKSSRKWGHTAVYLILISESKIPVNSGWISKIKVMYT